MFKEKDFRTKIIAIVKSMFPDLVVVSRFQNTTQPVKISDGDEMMDILIEKVIKTGSDWVERVDSVGNRVYHGERLIQLTLELFSSEALDKLNAFVSMLETESYIEFMTNLKIMHQRSGMPRQSTRLHGGIQYITSAIYTTRFHAGIEYIDGIGNPFSAIPDFVPDPTEFIPVGSIEHGEITGIVEDKEPIKTTF